MATATVTFRGILHEVMPEMLAVLPTQNMTATILYRGGHKGFLADSRVTLFEVKGEPMKLKALGRVLEDISNKTHEQEAEEQDFLKAHKLRVKLTAQEASDPVVALAMEHLFQKRPEPGGFFKKTSITKVTTTPKRTAELEAILGRPL